jgi:uncharacterized HAD superfamily protein
VERKKLLKIGVDFDGVVAYNPFRVIRAPIAYFKQNVLGIRKLRFFVPKNRWQKIIWTIVHGSSILPANGVGLLIETAKNNPIELYLITARFDCLKENTYRWIKKYGLENVFKEILINEGYEQPHIFKERIMKEKKLDYYIEDNWDIVSCLNGKTKTHVFWIYNVLDSRRKYDFKFPYLKKALEQIRKDESLI